MEANSANDRAYLTFEAGVTNEMMEAWANLGGKADPTEILLKRVEARDIWMAAGNPEPKYHFAD